ncbi:IS3 family transposase [Listeria rocourtiae]|uniref:IS3 family transposase n=1 Tax=Listeria rocourtiae TaxID=647910 RepID=UPI003D2F9891
MSKKLFSDTEIQKLKQNPNVRNVSPLAITYSDAFKRIFVERYLAGELPRAIFEAYHFDVSVLGMKRVEQCANRWKKAYEKDSVIGLMDNRKGAQKMPKRVLTPEETIQRQQAKIALLEEQVTVLKKLEKIEGRCFTRKDKLTTDMKFQWIQTLVMDDGFTRFTSYFCRLLEVSRSGYYRYIQCQAHRKQREKQDEIARDLIRKAFQRRGFKKGARSIKMVLENEFNMIYSRKKIRRIMRKYNIVCPHRKPNPYRRIATATKEHRVIPNKLKRQFKQGIPGKVLLTDITYLPYGQRKMAYLSTIKDGSTNEILAYHVSDRITLDIAIQTIKKLKKRRHLLHKEAFIHSDQGSHYTSPVYQKLLKKHRLGQSMSRRGNCWDNAPQESFFGHFKDDIDSRSFDTLAALKSKIDDYMVYYNNYRYQWNLKKMAPVQYRNHLLASA